MSSMDKIKWVVKCKRCERLMGQRLKASMAWIERNPDFERSEARKAYKREWIKRYRQKIKKEK